MISLEKFAEIINENFGPPFLEEDAVDAYISDEGTLCLRIARRDIEIDEDGNVINSAAEF